MKILMVNKFLYPRGGAETYMLKIGQCLAGRGHQVEYFGMYDRRNTVGNQAGLYTFHMDFRGTSPARFLYPFKILYSLEARRKMTAVLRAFDPDVVHLNNINFQLTPSVIDAAKKGRALVVQTVHDYQMICPNHLLYNLQEETVCQRCVDGSPWNCAKFRCIHGSRVKSILGAVESCISWGRHSYEKVDAYLCPSRFLERKLLERSPIFQGKTRVLRNFIELPAAEAPSRPVGAAPYVVFAGRLSVEKGVALLAQAARALPQVTFRVAGRGELAETLAHIPNIHLEGFLTGEPLTRLIAGAELALVPSVWYENCPLSILEAQALGTPVVTVNAGGMAELVEDRVTGLLLKEATGDCLAETLKTALADPQLLARMRGACLERRDEMVTLERYCDQLEALYQRAFMPESGEA